MTDLIRFRESLLAGLTLILSMRAVSMFLGGLRADYSFRFGLFDNGSDRHTTCHGISDLILYRTISRYLLWNW